MEFLSEAKKILDKMTLSEKIGQMNLVNITSENLSEMLAKAEEGQYGAYLTYETTEKDPEIHVKLMEASRKSRLGIPVLYGKDVIHGHFTVFPVGLGQAASFNPQLVEEAFGLIAREASTDGITWTFSPMMDIARDPRWGRICEGFGEDPYLASRMAEASVWGFQGRTSEQLKKSERLLACPKHFIGYGAAEGGRDANTVEISQNTLMNVYFPPFLAAMKAGAGSIMSGYHDLNGEPVSASQYLMETMIKSLGDLNGFIVSDYGTTTQLLKYRFAENLKHATALAANAGLDMDMCSFNFAEHLESLVKEGVVPETRIDDAVLRILIAKLRLDLWNRQIKPALNKHAYQMPEGYYQKAVEAACQSSILLVNKDNILPILNNRSNLYVAGPYAHTKRELYGAWTLDGLEHLGETVMDCLKKKLPQVDIKHEKSAFPDEVIRNCTFSDTVIYFAGESPERSGERNNIAVLDLPAGQEEQIRAFHRLGKKVVLVIVAGRPLCLASILPYVSAILYVFHPGTGGGEAIAQILAGESEPGGRLPVTMPYSEGQIPLYYNPIQVRADRPDHLRYINMTEKPLFPFGYGLTYTSFEISNLKVYPKEGADSSFVVTADIRNTGSRKGEAVVQCYINDCVSRYLRPCKELKGFVRIAVAPGATVPFQFSLGAEELGYFTPHGEWVVEPGKFKVFVGLNSENLTEGEFEL